MQQSSTQRSCTAAFALSVFAALFSTLAAHASRRAPAPDKLAPVVRRSLKEAGERPYVIQFRKTPGAADLRRVERAGARLTRKYDHLPMAAVVAGRDALGRITRLRSVTHVSPDLQVKAALNVAGPAVGADVARTKYALTGVGVGVALIDSGIANSNDFSVSSLNATSRVIAGHDYVANSSIYRGNDACGHGTCVAGILGGNAYNSTGLLTTKHFYGVATRVNLINLRVLDANGNGSVSNALAAINWCLTYRTKYNIRIINLSMGQPPCESYMVDPLCQACEAAWKSGIFVVCAAGNRGRVVASDPSSGVAYGTIDSPGNDPYVLTVGATNDYKTVSIGDDTVDTYSSRGPSVYDHILKPDLVAPGNKIVSVRDQGSTLDSILAVDNILPLTYYLGNLLGLGGSSQYFTFSGTSMAAPLASGAAALLLQQCPSLTPDDVKARLMDSAIKVWRTDGTTPDIYSRGAGYLNIPRALQSTALVSSYALSPYCTLDNGVVTIHWDEAVWTDQAMTSEHAVWADQSVDSDQAIWGDHAVWADQAIWSDHAVWADQTVAADHAVWADISPVAVNGD